MLKRTHHCGILRSTHVGQTVVLCGWINTYRDISYTTPFGGYKMSGIGRENGLEGIREYIQTKAVWISTAKEIANPFVIG